MDADDPAVSLTKLQSGIATLAEEVKRMRERGGAPGDESLDASGLSATDVAVERNLQVHASKLAALLMARPAGGA